VRGFPGANRANSHAGPLLRGLLLRLGIPEDFKDDPELAKAHVEFVSAQPVTDDTCYAASIELATAMDASLPILLATHINGEPLNQAHGGPIRVVGLSIADPPVWTRPDCPGTHWRTVCQVADAGRGAPRRVTSECPRQLEALLSTTAQNFYQQRDYKVLPPDVGPEEKAEALLSVRP
jgi:sulfite oxidase